MRGWPDGVEALDHAADVGVIVRANSLALLFERAAAGLRTLIEGEDDEAAGVPGTAGSTVELEAEHVALLLVDWLRELLYRHQVGHHAFAGVEFDRLDERRLRARVAWRPAAAVPVREIKGVTYHGLAVDTTAEGWRARVIFDV